MLLANWYQIDCGENGRKIVAKPRLKRNQMLCQCTQQQCLIFPEWLKTTLVVSWAKRYAKRWEEYCLPGENELNSFGPKIAISLSRCGKC